MKDYNVDVISGMKTWVAEKHGVPREDNVWWAEKIENQVEVGVLLGAIEVHRQNHP